eukprot:41629-Eustigmatos_ZCMA.PRE.1
MWSSIPPVSTSMSLLNSSSLKLLFVMIWSTSWWMCVEYTSGSKLPTYSPGVVPEGPQVFGCPLT